MLIELLADRVGREGWSADAALVLAPSRAGATRLRDAVALRLGVPTNGPRVRTVLSLAFELVTALLIVAVVGAIAVARGRQGVVRKKLVLASPRELFAGPPRPQPARRQLGTEGAE